jgi:molybdopterin-binding protein
MKISARNQFQGTVVNIEQGAINSMVAIEIAPSVVIRSMITQSAVEELGLEVGKPATAIIKAPNVLVAVE